MEREITVDADTATAFIQMADALGVAVALMAVSASNAGSLDLTGYTNDLRGLIGVIPEDEKYARIQLEHIAAFIAAFSPPSGDGARAIGDVVRAFTLIGGGKKAA